jgi:hypothetical protein
MGAIEIRCVSHGNQRRALFVVVVLHGKRVAAPVCVEHKRNKGERVMDGCFMSPSLLMQLESCIGE